MGSKLEAVIEILTWDQSAIDLGAKSTILGELYAKISSHFEVIQDEHRAIESTVIKNLIFRYKKLISGRWHGSLMKKKLSKIT